MSFLHKDFALIVTVRSEGILVLNTHQIKVRLMAGILNWPISKHLLHSYIDLHDCVNMTSRNRTETMPSLYHSLLFVPHKKVCVWLG